MVSRPVLLSPKPRPHTPSIRPGKNSMHPSCLGGSILLWGCFAAGGTSLLHKINGIMKEEHYVKIPKQDLMSLAKTLKRRHRLIFQKPYGYNQGGFKTTKLIFWCGHHEALISVQ